MPSPPQLARPHRLTRADLRAGAATPARSTSSPASWHLAAVAARPGTCAGAGHPDRDAPERPGTAHAPRERHASDRAVGVRSTRQ